MKEISLTQGKVALVDDIDYDRVSQYKWCAYESRGIWYAMSNIKIDKKYRHTKLHRFILGLSVGQKCDVDHINHNTLDNRRCNLRVCSHSENMKNRLRGVGTSRFIGVSWDKQSRKWVVNIRVNNRQRNLGRYIFEELAALAYDFAALKYHREFANFNF